jgi:hypothetical protein
MLVLFIPELTKGSVRDGFRWHDFPAEALNCFNQLIYVMKTQCFSCKIGDEFLNII